MDVLLSCCASHAAAEKGRCEFLALRSIIQFAGDIQLLDSIVNEVHSEQAALQEQLATAERCCFQALSCFLNQQGL